jgi:hypothetical protein
MSGTAALAIYGAALAALSIGWQVYSYAIKSNTERRERGSRAVGGVLAFLWGIDPETGFVGGIPEDKIQEAIDQKMDIWEPLRQELEALRVADPRPAVDEKAAATIDAVTESFTDSVWAIRRRRDEGAMTEQEWANLRTKYADAKQAAEELKQAVRS